MTMKIDSGKNLKKPEKKPCIRRAFVVFLFSVGQFADRYEYSLLFSQKKGH